MDTVYNDPRAPGSFGGVENLRRYTRHGRRAVENFLSTQDAYTLHKPARVRFQRRKTYSKGIADLFQIDLVDLSNLSMFNDGYRYLITCIDVFTKRAWALPLKTKTGREVAAAFEKILREQMCNMVQGDKGTEFTNSVFQSMLRSYGIHFYTSENDDIKAAIVERFNRTLKEKMYRYFTFKHTRRYIEVLPDLLNAYNNTYHRSIGMAPVEVTAETEQLVRSRLYPTKPKRFKWKYSVGDTVRISLKRLPFRKGYVGHWSEELFIIKTRLPTVPVTYELQDLAGEAIKGKFYTQELQKVSKPSNALYDIEKILKTRRRGGKVSYLVKWKGYPAKFNSWIDAITRR